MKTKELWFGFLAVITVSFSVLLIFGREIYRQAPPIPEKVTTTDGTWIFTGQEIKDGQNVWQSIGGQELGTIWGHGSYVAPDWSADWLHREIMNILNELAYEIDSGKFEDLPTEKQAYIIELLKKEIRTNTYNSNDKVLVISDRRVRAIENNSEYYAKLFTNDPFLKKLREA